MQLQTIEQIARAKKCAGRWQLDAKPIGQSGPRANGMFDNTHRSLLSNAAASLQTSTNPRNRKEEEALSFGSPRRPICDSIEHFSTYEIYQRAAVGSLSAILH
jgi:hypothetical protein